MRDFGCGRYENLSGAIPWFTFLRAEQLKPGEAKGIGGGNSRRNGDLFLAEAEQPPLFCPIRRQPWREAHQCLGGELRRFSAIDDGRGDVGREPRKTQKGVEVGC